MTQSGGKEPPREAHAAAPASDPHPEKLKAVEAERDRLKGDLAETRDRFLRARADYDNLMRRSAKETADAAKASKGALIHRLLGSLEVLEKVGGDLEKNDSPAAKGVRMVLDDLRKTLKDEGVKPIEGVGTVFNYRFHQAVDRTETSGKPEGTILEVIQRGYLIGDEVLRHALVRVAVPPKEPAAAPKAPAAKGPAPGGP